MSQIPRHLLQQQQRLTPQLIQAMDILQLNSMALEARITQEIDGNPALELAPGEDEEARPESPAIDVADEQPEGEQTLIVEEGDAQDFARLDNLVSEYDWLEDDEYRGTKSRERLYQEGDSKMEAMANAPAHSVNLRDYLLDQWSLLDFEEEVKALGAVLIDNIDDSGRLAVSLEELASKDEASPPIKKWKDALARVQQLDPPGVGNRGVQECLLLQLEAAPGATNLERQIIEEHLETLEKNHLPQIAKALGVDIEDVKAAVGVIGRLSLHPGMGVVDRVAPVIVPDIMVEYNEEEDCYETSLARGNLRELRISPEFRQALEKSRDNKKARAFIKQKLEAANAVIDAIRYRKQRLLEVAKAVVAAQRDFLAQGEQHMKVLRMSELAGRFSCDPSTISRTVDGKWMQTPRGIYPLRRFFTGGTEAGDGEALGWDSIKAKVQEIVDNENKRQPLTDDEIVARLKQTDIAIKRRTVAKYRGQLNIPTARQRRLY